MYPPALGIACGEATMLGLGCKICGRVRGTRTCALGQRERFAPARHITHTSSSQTFVVNNTITNSACRLNNCDRVSIYLSIYRDYSHFRSTIPDRPGLHISSTILHVAPPIIHHQQKSYTIVIILKSTYCDIYLLPRTIPDEQDQSHPVSIPGGVEGLPLPQKLWLHANFKDCEARKSFQSYQGAFRPLILDQRGINVFSPSSIDN